MGSNRVTIFTYLNRIISGVIRVVDVSNQRMNGERKGAQKRNDPQSGNDPDCPLKS